MRQGGAFGLEGAASKEVEPKNRFCQSRIVMVEKNV